MRSLRTRFVLSHILPLLIIIPLAGVVITYILETQVLLKELADNINGQANQIAQVANSEPGIWTDSGEANAYINNVSLYVEENVFLLDRNGRLLASKGSIEETVPTREGLTTATSGQSSLIVNYSLRMQRVEALVPVNDENQQLLGIVGVTETLRGTATIFGRLRQFILLALAVQLGLGIILGLLLAARLERPIGQAIEAMNNIAHGQQVDPLPEKGAAELRQLAWSVNTLAARLRNLEETRRRLLANLVHEIGRPLGAIRSAIHTVRHVVGDDPVVRDELLAGMEQEVERMQPLLEDLAQLHGQVLGKVTLAPEPVDLREWLSTLQLPWRAAAREKGLQWEANIPENLPEIAIDSSRMGQVLGNLLSNAIKYTPAGGKVTVTAGADQTQVWIEVTDNGPGIIPEEQEQIFEAFYRSKQERRFPQGLGLGLTIARDLAEAHGGSLELNSDPGKGSRFTVRLPLNKVTFINSSIGV